MLARCLSVAVFRVAGSGAFEQRANPRGDRVEPEDPIAEGAKRCFWSICYRNPYFDRYLAIEESKLDPPGLIEGQKVKAGLVAEAAGDREQSTPKDEPDCDRSWQGHVVREEPEAPTITQPVLEQPQTPEAQVAEWKKKCPPLADDFRPRRSRYRFRGCKRFEARSQTADYSVRGLEELFGVERKSIADLAYLNALLPVGPSLRSAFGAKPT